jgi:Fe-S-cluster-containing dehydrogenase component
MSGDNAAKEKVKNPKYAMVIDTRRCIGCHACVTACQNQNELSAGEFFNRIEEHSYGEFPNFNRRMIPVQCQHCDDAPCVSVCPVGASVKGEDGIVVIDRLKCIGCKYCILACPYGARSVNEETGCVHKCDFCRDFVLKGEKPACQTTCPMSVRWLGNLNDPNDKIHALIASGRPITLLPKHDTRPSVYYLW